MYIYMNSGISMGHWALILVLLRILSQVKSIEAYKQENTQRVVE